MTYLYLVLLNGRRASEMKYTVLDVVKFQTTETQLESYIETLKSTVAMLNNRIGELQETLSQVREKVTQLRDVVRL
jgi:prefoldin subunit 5